MKRMVWPTITDNDHAQSAKARYIISRDSPLFFPKHSMVTIMKDDPKNDTIAAQKAAHHIMSTCVEYQTLFFAILYILLT